jgi:3-methyladenine DNA glycosylase/8-oxoguanine DNA glycosylase
MTAVIAATAETVAQRSVDIGATLSWFRHGAADPTTWLTTIGRGPSGAGHFVRATLTPDGPGTLSIRWSGQDINIEAYGSGADWLRERAPMMLGSADTDDHGLEASKHPAVSAAARANRHLRIGASGDLYHELLPTIIEQRITAGEAHQQWKRLCFELGEPAPGPFTRLLLPPEPAVLARRPSWWFHPLGIERKRAEPLIDVARHASKFWGWSAIGPNEAATKLRLVRGVGQWSIGSVLGPALGDPDAVAVGDFHLKNMIAHNLAGEVRGTDERMLELLKPYAGQRGRVVRYVAHHGSAAPKFGPKKRIMPMHAW